MPGDDGEAAPGNDASLVGHDRAVWIICSPVHQDGLAWQEQKRGGPKSLKRRMECQRSPVRRGPNHPPRAAEGLVAFRSCRNPRDWLDSKGLLLMDQMARARLALHMIGLGVRKHLPMPESFSVVRCDTLQQPIESPQYWLLLVA